MKNTQPSAIKAVSLAHKVLFKMGGRITFIIIVVTFISYWHVESILEQQVLEQLTKYIGERGDRESQLFQLAEKNQQLFRNEYLARYQKNNTVENEKFQQYFQTGTDGATRLYPKYYTGFDKGERTNHYLTGLINKNTQITPELKYRVLTAYELINQLAPAWSNQFIDFYANFPENAAILYWPNMPWALDAPADFNFIQEEYFYIADEAHNPQRNTVWTGSYFDTVAKDYMVSGETPIYIEDKLRLIVGNDILLSELLDRTLHNCLEGTYNIIFRQDGRLIAHPLFMSEIKKTAGNFLIQHSENETLVKLFEQVITVNGNTTTVLRDKYSHDLIGVTHIKGPDWYFVTLYPSELLEKQAFSTARFILMMGVLSLIIEVIMLFWILNRQITTPLNSFITSTSQLAGGHFDGQMVNNLPLSQSDEIGSLARAFLKMSKALKTAFENLEHKNTELQEKENRYRTLFDNSNDAILIIENDHFVDCNLKSIELFSCDRAWIIEHAPCHLSPALQADGQNSATQSLEFIKKALDGEAQFFEWTHLRQNGDLFDAEVSLNKVSLNQKIYIQAIVRDITERKQMELNRLRLVQEQEAKNAALRYSNEIESKNQDLLRLNQEKNEFLGIAAHDLKNPLSGILGLAEIMSLSAENISAPEITEYAGMIESSARQMFDLITNLLDVNKIESGKFDLTLTAFDLQSLLRKIIKTYQERANNKHIQLHFSGNATQLYSDQNITQQVLDNLISNAIKYSPTEKNVYICLKTQANKVRCEIRDEGPGLSKADQEKLFGKFTRLSTKPTGGEHSTGLGLFIVKKLVTALQGEVWCESELGQGATFIVEFSS